MSEYGSDTCVFVCVSKGGGVALMKSDWEGNTLCRANTARENDMLSIHGQV